MNIKVLLEELAPKAGVNLQNLLEGKLEALESITISEEDLASFKKLLNETEAVNSPSIVNKYKDKVHQEAVLAVNQSYESTHDVVMDELTDEEKVSFKELKTGKEKTKFLLQTLKDKAKIAKDAGSTADVKALEGIIADLKKNKDLVEANYTELSKKVDGIDKQERLNKKLLSAIKRNEILSIALRSNKISEDERSKPLFESTTVLAVDEYLKTKRYGVEQLQASLVYDEEMERYVVRQKTNKEMAIPYNDKVLSVEDLVMQALDEFKITKKSDAASNYVPVGQPLPKNKLQVNQNFDI